MFAQIYFCSFIAALLDCREGDRARWNYRRRRTKRSGDTLWRCDIKNNCWQTGKQPGLLSLPCFSLKYSFFKIYFLAARVKLLFIKIHVLQLIMLIKCPHKKMLQNASKNPSLGWFAQRSKCRTPSRQNHEEQTFYWVSRKIQLSQKQTETQENCSKPEETANTWGFQLTQITSGLTVDFLYYDAGSCWLILQTFSRASHIAN